MILYSILFFQQFASGFNDEQLFLQIIYARTETSLISPLPFYTILGTEGQVSKYQVSTLTFTLKQQTVVQQCEIRGKTLFNPIQVWIAIIASFKKLVNLLRYAATVGCMEVK